MPVNGRVLGTPHGCNVAGQLRDELWEIFMHNGLHMIQMSCPIHRMRNCGGSQKRRWHGGDRCFAWVKSLKGAPWLGDKSAKR